MSLMILIIENTMGAEVRKSNVFNRANSRLTSVCREIARGTFPDVKELAARLETSERTVKRIIAFMRDEFGAPIRSDRKRGGYYFTEPNWQLPSLSFSDSDLLAFFIAENNLRVTGNAGDAAKLRRSLAKVASMLPPEIAVNLAAFNENVSFENRPFLSADPVLLERIASVAMSQQTAEFDYYSPHSGQRSRRTVDVHLLHNFAGDWFAVSWDHARGDFRDFHVGRMSGLRVTGNFFEKQANFDAQEYLKRGFSMMRGGRLTAVAIEFDAYQARWIRERRQFHREEQREELPDGGLRLSFKVGQNGLEAVARFCLKYAGHCRVLKPRKLKEIVVERLKKGLDLNCDQ